MVKEIICTVCPLSCVVVLELNEQDKIINVSGNKCARGKTYAIKEHTTPERTLTTIIRIKGGLHPLLPVRTSEPIPKSLLQAGMRATAGLTVESPVRMGDVIIRNFLDLGVDLIASRNL